MAAPRRAAVSGKPKLSPMLEARFMVAADKVGLTPSAALADAAERWIKWADQEGKRNAFKAAQADYDAGRSDTSPEPARYGLRPDAGLPRP